VYGGEHNVSAPFNLCAKTNNWRCSKVDLPKSRGKNEQKIFKQIISVFAWPADVALNFSDAFGHKISRYQGGRKNLL
jgi:hypothetical protein